MRHDPRGKGRDWLEVTAEEEGVILPEIPEAILDRLGETLAEAEETEDAWDELLERFGRVRARLELWERIMAALAAAPLDPPGSRSAPNAGTSRTFRRSRGATGPGVA